MKFSFFILYAVIICLQSCKDNKTKDSTEMLKELVKHENIIVENFNFQFDLPQDWYRLDTVFQGIQLNLIMNNDETYQPRINITRELMNGINHSDYILGTKKYLTTNMSGINILEDGQFYISGNSCKWYTYNKLQNGIRREMIYYSIAENNISYNITAGLNTGGRKKYKKTIDEIVSTFSRN